MHLAQNPVDWQKLAYYIEFRCFVCCRGSIASYPCLGITECKTWPVILSQWMLRQIQVIFLVKNLAGGRGLQLLKDINSSKKKFSILPASQNLTFL